MMKIKKLYENIDNCLSWIKINNSDLKDIFKGAEVLLRGLQVIKYDRKMIGDIDTNYFITDFIIDIIKKNLPEYQASLDLIDDALDELDIDNDTLNELDEDDFMNHILIKNTLVDVKEALELNDYFGITFESLLNRFEFSKSEISSLM